MSADPETAVATTTPTESKADEQRPKLSLLNFVNVLAFIVNLTFTYGVGTNGWFGNGTNAELSEKYQTIVTPNSFAFIIWSVIFLAQGIFVVVQLLPRYRARPVVREGVGYWYTLTCLAQVGWTFSFTYEVIWLSLICMLLIWASLVGILYFQYDIVLDTTTLPSQNRLWLAKLLDFWLFRFPFHIHCGWLTAASAVNVNVLVVDLDAPAHIQLAVGIISLAVLHAIGVWVVFGLRAHPNYTLVSVLVWANYWIFVELSDEPKELIVSTFSQDIIDGVRLAAVAVSIILLLQIVVRLAFQAKTYFLGNASSSVNTAQEGDKLLEEDPECVPGSPAMSVEQSA